ncbi:sensor histidine kinase [Carboxylicivirga sp. N1Y90]|uniref:sensor histidine kinase n=1 Tax=Carboxylicivirga fragile TaxID=3417571 RepID=UPI003D329654|nr:PAS domain-containing protein [Marinilabiliaceae bacterium N1Y90]
MSEYKKHLCFFQILLFLSFSSLGYSQKLKEIVILNSYHFGYQWSNDINSSIIKHFETDESIRIFSEFMDSKRFNSDTYFDALKTKYALKYSKHPIDGIICSDNRAFDFYLKHGNEIWGNVPAVICGVNNVEEYDLEQIDSKLAVVLEKIDVSGTLQLMQKLQPSLDEIYVISDNTLSGQIFTNQFNQAILKTANHLKISYLNTDNPTKLKEQLNKLDKENKAIYLLSLYTNRDGIPNEMIHESHYFFDGINIPIYSNWDFLLHDCIVGGQIIQAKDQGKHAANLMSNFLNGENPPLFTSPAQKIILDYNQLEKYNFSIPDSINEYNLINEPVDFIREFKNELIIVLTVLIVLLIIILILISDIIKRKKVELSLVSSEERLELAMDGANEGLWDVDFHTGNVFLNDQFALLLGYDSKKEINIDIVNWKNFIWPDDIIQLKEAYDEHKSQKTDTIKCELRCIKKNGEASWFSIHGKITERYQNNPVRLTGIIMNIDAQKKFEYQLTLAKEKAEESDRLKSSFLANMSHEIRTPMNAILGFTDLLTEQIHTESERIEYLQFIKNSGENLLTLINDIIDISKIESGQLKIQHNSFNFHQLLQELQAIGKQLIESQKKNIELRLIVSNMDDKFLITSDKLRLYQIMLNLISNAIKFTDSGYVAISYEVIENTKLKISVKDTGPGISDENLKIIFDRFRQVDESSIKKHGGTGLGLSITQSLVKLLNGKINVNSQFGEGATFVVELPNTVSASKKILQL